METSLILCTISLFSLLTVTGCHSRLKEPYLIDAIYQEVLKEKNAAQTELSSLAMEIGKAEKAVSEAPIRTGQRRDAEEEYFSLKKKEQKSIENFRYLSVTAEQRMKIDILAYEKAYDEKKPWPDTTEYEIYNLEAKLKAAPREWSPHLKSKERAPAAKSEDHSE